VGSYLSQQVIYRKKIERQLPPQLLKNQFLTDDADKLAECLQDLNEDESAYLVEGLCFGCNERQLPEIAKVKVDVFKNPRVRIRRVKSSHRGIRKRSLLTNMSSDVDVTSYDEETRRQLEETRKHFQQLRNKFGFVKQAPRKDAVKDLAGILADYDDGQDPIDVISEIRES